MKKIKWTPSNGTEGMLFESEWCGRCAKNPINPEAKTQCGHLLKALTIGENSVWILKDDLPVCTAFVDREQSNAKARTARLRRRRKKITPQMELF